MLARWLALPLLVLGLSACADEAVTPTFDPENSDPCPNGQCSELSVGKVELDEKTDGNWGEALKCKPIPQVEPLVDPEIIVSLRGATVRLRDRAGTYERVFPMGPGAIDPETGESLTPTSDMAPEGVFYTRTEQPARQDSADPNKSVWAWNYSCRFYGVDPEPYFAGLPFIRLEGPPTLGYGFHGPIDRFTTPEGGTLRRGYVSHGCMRMQAQDIVELWGRIQGHKTPVRIQKAVDRGAEGRPYDVEQNFFLAECVDDADCRFDGGVCHHNPYEGRGYCTKACGATGCPDKVGYPTSRCVQDPDAAEGQGFCTLESNDTNQACARYGSFEPVVATSLSSGRDVTVCQPAPKGWVGSLCAQDADCASGLCNALPADPSAEPSAEPDASFGVCSAPCDRFCDDVPGAPTTFCADALPAEDGQGRCVARCGDDNDCPGGWTCEAQERHGQPSIKRGVCVP
jgi:hypothetical protein